MTLFFPSGQVKKPLVRVEKPLISRTDTSLYTSTMTTTHYPPPRDFNDPFQMSITTAWSEFWSNVFTQNYLYLVDAVWALFGFYFLRYAWLTSLQKWLKYFILSFSGPWTSEKNRRQQLCLETTNQFRLFKCRPKDQIHESQSAKPTRYYFVLSF